MTAIEHNVLESVTGGAEACPIPAGETAYNVPSLGKDKKQFEQWLTSMGCNHGPVNVPGTDKAYEDRRQIR